MFLECKRLVFATELIKGLRINDTRVYNAWVVLVLVDVWLDVGENLLNFANVPGFDESQLASGRLAQKESITVGTVIVRALRLNRSAEVLALMMMRVERIGFTVMSALGRQNNHFVQANKITGLDRIDFLR